ncbi:Elongation factor Ts [Spatholobus suberectus]|nr:Elongation factor Ts [Spatholobus suberectus]
MTFYGAAKRVCVSVRLVAATSCGRECRYYSSSASENVNLIKQLRERTSAPIKDVKAALVDSNWDIEAAQKELRKRGKVLASKKSSRTASKVCSLSPNPPPKLLS